MDEPKKKFEKVTFPREIRYALPEHQICMSFSDDEGTEAFEIWWSVEGAAAFNEWLSKNLYYKHLIK